MKFTKVLVLLLVLGLIAAACAGEDTPPPTTKATTTTTAATTTTATPTTTEAPMAEVGSAENPIKVLFVPSVEAEVIVTGGDIMKAALEEATGLKFEVTIPPSHPATIAERCASPDNTMGFIPGLGYVLASNRCGVDVSFKAVRFGFPVYWTQVLG